MSPSKLGLYDLRCSRILVGTVHDLINHIESYLGELRLSMVAGTEDCWFE